MKMRTGNRKLKIIRLFFFLLICTVAYIIFFRLTQNKIVQADYLVKFDEGHGTTFSDSLGGASGSVWNALWKPEEFCRNGMCFYFDGTDDYLYFGDNANFDFTASANFTIEFWFRTKDVTTGTRVFVSKYRGDDAEGGYKVYMNSDGKVVFGVDDDNSFEPDDSAISVNAYDDNLWHHVTAVKTGTTSLTLYMDALKVAEDLSIQALGTLVNDDQFLVGYDYAGNAFTGYMDELKVYTTTARTEAEIKTDVLGVTTSQGAAASFGPDNSYLSDGLVGYWKMDEYTWGTPDCSTAVVLDSSGNSNGGLACPASTGPTGTAVGKYGRGGSFDGGDYIDVLNSTSIDIPNSLTINMWLYSTATGTQYVLDKKGGTLGTAETGGYMFGISSVEATGLSFTVSDGVTASRLNSGTDNEIRGQSRWGMVSLVYDAINKQQYIYINGALKASQPVNIGNINAGQNMRFATGITSLSYFTGNTDEVRIYNRVLSPAEVQDLYNWAPGPMGYWKMDESTGTQAHDSSGNNIIGTLTDTGNLWKNGKIGGGYQPSSTNSRIQLTNSASVKGLSEFTIEAWVYPTSTLSSGGWTYITNENSSDNTSYTRAGLGAVNNYAGCGTNVFWGLYRSAGQGSTVVCGTTTFQINQWYHVTGIYNSNTDAHLLYVNGVLDKTYSLATPAIDNNNPLGLPAIGNWESGGGYNFRGILDDVKIYNYARTQGQIIEDMNAGHPAPGSPIGSALAHWKFDEGYGSTAQDSSVNGYDGTIATVETSINWTNDGKFGKALNNGWGDVEVLYDNPFDFTSTDDFTLSTWVKSDNADNPAEDQYLITKNDATSRGYGIFFNSSGQLKFGIDDDTTWNPDASVNTTEDYFDGSWHHIVAVKQGTSKIEIFVDGILKDTETSGLPGDLYSVGWLYFFNPSTGGNTFTGSLDEINIFRSALTADQVKLLYNQGQGTVFGTLSTASDNSPSNSSTDSYCPPGQGTTCVGPVTEWMFDEKTGTAPNDTSENGRTGSFSSIPQWKASCKHGACLYFDGTDDGVFNNTAVVSAYPFTIQAWVKGTPSTFQKTVISLADKDSTNIVYAIGTDSSGNCRIYSGNGSLAVATSCNYTTNDGQWHLLTTVFTSNTSRTMYVDGKFDQTDTTSVTFNSAVDRISVGHSGESNDAGFYPGQIDEARVYGYARTPAQIAWDYNRGEPLAHWRFDECTGTVANDSSGNGYTGTIAPGDTSGDNDTVGTCSSGVTTEMWNDGTTGKRNASLGFDGYNDHVEINSSLPTGSTTNNHSFSAWVKQTSAPSANQFIFFNGSGGCDGWGVFTDNSASDHIHILNECMGTASSAVTLSSNTWAHIAVVWESSVYKLYINSNEVSLSTPSGYGLITPATRAIIGARTNTPTEVFNGQIDDVKIFNYALTAQQIKTLYNDGSVNFGD